MVEDTQEILKSKLTLLLKHTIISWYYSHSILLNTCGNNMKRRSENDSLRQSVETLSSDHQGSLILCNIRQIVKRVQGID